MPGREVGLRKGALNRAGPESWSFGMFYSSFGSNMREFLLLEYASGLFAHPR